MSYRLVILGIILLVLAIYVAVPPLIALVRRHPERRLIYKLSPLALLSFILWGALLLWAASDRRDDAVISKYVAKLRGSNRLPLVVGLLVAVGVVGGAVTLLRWG